MTAFQRLLLLLRLFLLIKSEMHILELNVQMLVDMPLMFGPSGIDSAAWMMRTTRRTTNN